jgi:hypothetical protein
MAFINAALQDFPRLALIKLQAGEKIPTERFATCKARTQKMNLTERMQLAAEWFKKQNNVGLVIHHAGVWVLDLDTSEGLPYNVEAEIERLAPPQVGTPSGGRHCYFRLPEELVDHPEMKAHVNLRTVPGINLKADLKLGGRQTLVVAPGSRRATGDYAVLQGWSMPPVLDPRDLFPAVQLFRKAASSEPEAEFLKDNRCLKSRVARAVYYLAKARVSVSGDHGHGRLDQVCAHLCSFLHLPIELAYALLTRPVGASWNDRCLDKATGDVYPWSREELLEALERGKQAVPAYGVHLFKLRQAERLRDKKIKTASKIIQKHASGGCITVPIRDVYNTAMAAMGLDSKQCSATRFGTALGRLGVKRERRGRGKVWSLDLRHGLDKLHSDLEAAISRIENKANPEQVDTSSPTRPG